VSDEKSKKVEEKKVKKTEKKVAFSAPLFKK
jgi:hypothetical protein